MTRIGAGLVLSLSSLLWLAPTGAQARSSVKAGAMTINGQTVRNVACELDKGGLFAVMSVVGVLAKEKKALDACAPAGAAYRVKWTWVGDKTTNVEVLAASDAKGSACIVKALQLTKGDNEGDCQATVLVGKAEAAGKAADALPGAPAAK